VRVRLDGQEQRGWLEWAAAGLGRPVRNVPVQRAAMGAGGLDLPESPEDPLEVGSVLEGKFNAA
jgi:hypothetical protein